MSFGEGGNPTSRILKFLIQNVLFLTPKTNWINLTQNLMLYFFSVISPQAKHIESIIIEHRVLKNSCMSPSRKLKMTKLLRFLITLMKWSIFES